jgi:hypothetical protein
MSQSRSTSLSLLRSNAALIFEDYKISVAYFEARYTQRDTVPEIRRLLGLRDTDNADSKYPRFPPILCQDDDTKAAAKRFLNPVLFRVRFCLSSRD